MASYAVFNFFKDFIYFLREGREKERERNISVWFRAPPHRGPGLQPRHVPWLGIEPTTLWFAGGCSVHWATQPGPVFNFFNFEVILNSHAVVRNNRERSHVPFTQFASMVIFCKTTAWYHIQYIDIDSVKLQSTPISTRMSPVLPFQTYTHSRPTFTSPLAPRSH